MFIRNLILTYGTELILLGVNFLSGVILARILSTADRGILALVMATPLTLVALFHLGIPQASVYMIGREKLPPRKVAGNALALSLIAGMIVGLVFYTLRVPIATNFLSGLGPQHMIIIAALIPLTLVNGTLLALLSANQRFDRYNLQRLVCSSIQLVGFVGLVWLKQGGVTAGIYVLAGVGILGIFLSTWMVWRDIPIHLQIDTRTSRSMLRFGIKSYLQFLFSNLAFRLDLFLIALYLPTDQAAYYSVAVSLAELAWLLPDSAGLVLYPRLTHTKTAEVGDITARVLRGVVTMTVGIVLALLLVGQWLLPLLYGPAYQKSVAPFLGLLPGILLMSVYKVLARHFTSLGKQKYSIIASGSGLILIIGLDLWLIPIYGIVGAALISSVGYGLSSLLLLIFFIHQNKIPLSSCVFLEAQEWKAVIGFVKLAAERLLKYVLPAKNLKKMVKKGKA